MTVDDALRTYGLLLQQDKELPSVAGIIAGEPVRGSWWSHPKGRAIFAEVQRLEHRDDVLATRLVSGKVTYVHERLWPAFLAVATANEPWQREGLPAAARKLLARVEAEGSVRASGDAARELQARLLVAAREVHTESGKHATELSTWNVGAGFSPLPPPEAARHILEEAVSALGATAEVLPWRAARGPRRTYKRSSPPSAGRTGTKATRRGR
jgi:hypothetical protein